jgi:hypothetical protein
MQLANPDLTSHQSGRQKQRIKELMNAQDPQTFVYPIKRIPNVRKFKVEVLSRYHPVFESAGIKKREFDPLITSEPHFNRQANKYIRHQLTRLNKHRDNPALF